MNTLSDQISGEVADYILRSGDAPVTEHGLAAKFNISRTPIREILKSLQSDGLIESRRRGGISVRKHSKKEIEDIFDARALMEGYAARLAAERITERDVEALMKLCESYEAARDQGDDAAAEDFDRRIHEKIIFVSGNSFLLNLLKRVRLFTFSFLLRRAHASVAHEYGVHDAMIAALRSGDPVRSEEATRAHILHSKDQTFKAIDACEIALSEGKWWKD